jgi:phage terminase large subunit-like protein
MPDISPEWSALLRLIPQYDPIVTAGDAWFDPVAAQLAIDFFPECLRHVEGDLAGMPFVLQPWQRSIIANLFGWKRLDVQGREVRRYRECLVYVPRKNGKALALDTPIPTPTGWTTMGQLAVNDIVFADDGRPTRVIEALDVLQGRQCYRVEFSDGEAITCDAEHLWETIPRRNHRGPSCGWKGMSRGDYRPLAQERIFTTKEIRDTLNVECESNTKRNGAERNHRIKTCGPLQIPRRELPVDPYVLGVWLGDGDSDCARITVGRNDTEILDHLAACGVSAKRNRCSSLFEAVRYRIGGKSSLMCSRGHERAIHWRKNHCRVCERETDRARRGGASVPPKTNVCLNAHLRAMGLLNNKHIPFEYLRSSEEQRMALMQGLMDTDGYSSENGLQCEFTTVKPALRDGFIELATSLGFKPNLKVGRATIYGKDCGEKYRITFTAFADRPVFRLVRKNARLRPAPSKPTRSMFRQIVSVEPVPSVPVRCITVDSPRQLYLCGRAMIPTHNTPLAAGVALYALFCDNEPGAQCYIAAGDREQAGMLFRQARGMVDQEQELSSRCDIYGGLAAGGQSRSIVRKDDASFLRVISAEANTKHGGNTHLAIIDELHVQPNRDLVDVLRTSMASVNRRQPLLVYITTADFGRPSICNEVHDYACKVRDGIIDDPRFLPVVYEKRPEEDWTSEETWARVNPNLGVSVSLEYLRAECVKAQENAAYENTFRRLHLNEKTESDVRAIPMDKWDACGLSAAGEPADSKFWREAAIERLRRSVCTAGLDLGSTSDLTALVLLFREKAEDGGETFTLLPYFWVPRESARLRSRRDRVPYEQWIKEGFVTATEGDATDYASVRADINELAQTFSIRALEVDRLFQGAQLCSDLMSDGLPVEAFGQGFYSMAAPTKRFMELIASGQFRHGNNPVLRWMASNLSTESDAAGNLKPSKKKSSEKVDGIVSAVMALAKEMGPADDAAWYTPGSLLN